MAASDWSFGEHRCPQCDRVAYRWVDGESMWRCGKCGYERVPGIASVEHAIQMAEPDSQDEALSYLRMLERERTGI